MKTVFKYSWSIIAVLSLLMITSCGDDEEPIIDPGDGGINVSNGLYLSLEDNDPSSTRQLLSEVVEAEGFASQSRDGFTANFMYVEAGNYNIVEIADKEIVTTIGGTIETVTDEGSSCDHNNYLVVTTAENGASFEITEAGLYKVTHDQKRNELVLYNIKDANIIGSATPGGWSADTPLAGTIADDGATWSATDVVLRSGEWKVRFNCRWGINRRIDPNGSLDDVDNGYQLFTNFGGSTTMLVPGGSNIAQEEDATYTVTLNWDPRDGFSLSAERTGDAPTISFNPNDFQMAVIGDGTNSADTDGDGTPDGWQSDRNLFHKFEDDVHTWYGVVTLEGSGQYKFRANDLWDFNLGGDLTNLTSGGDNLEVPGAGAYYIQLSTADDGDTWSATVEEGGWGVIGPGSPAGNWDGDMDLMAQGNVGGISTYTLTGDFTVEDWKFRAGDQWAHALGGDLSFLTTEGGNIALGMPGNYTVTLSFDGEVYSASVVQ